MKRTALYEKHKALGAKLVDFEGWEMPVQYEGIIPEHEAVRNHVGIFDVSHMGKIVIAGPEAESFLDFISTNHVKGKEPLTATYTVLCDEDGGCVDDVIIYKESRERFFVIVNASNREKDLEHLQKHAKTFDVTIEDQFETMGILAIQGPEALPLISKLFHHAEQVKPMHFAYMSYHSGSLILSRTGYTGAGGFEIYGQTEAIVELWDTLFSLGKEHHLKPIGLGARDTLRLEMGFALYGHELSPTIMPTESVSAWTVKTEKNFLGKDAILNSSKKRHEYGIILREKGIARQHYPVYSGDEEIGTVTSGTFSPTLKEAIAIILVNKELSLGATVDVEIRNKRTKAEVVKLPFYKKER